VKDPAWDDLFAVFALVSYFDMVITYFVLTMERFSLLEVPYPRSMVRLIPNSLRIATEDVATLEVKNGFGKHVATLTPAQIVRCLQVCFSSSSNIYRLISV
jgi:hypothetical protein